MADSKTIRTNRSENGRFEVVIADYQLINYINSQSKELTTREVAEHFEMWLSTAYAKLNKLSTDGQIKGRMLGHTMLWSKNVD